MIDLKNAWNVIYLNASKELEEKTVYRSVRNKAEYQIKAVEKQKIIILTKKVDKDLSKKSFENQLKRLIENDGVLSYHAFFGNVAKETIAVFLHPQLDWDKDGQNIKDIS